MTQSESEWLRVTFTGDCSRDCWPCHHHRQHRRHASARPGCTWCTISKCLKIEWNILNSHCIDIRLYWIVNDYHRFVCQVVNVLRYVVSKRYEPWQETVIESFESSGHITVDSFKWPKPLCVSFIVWCTSAHRSLHTGVCPSRDATRRGVEPFLLKASTLAFPCPNHNPSHHVQNAITIWVTLQSLPSQKYCETSVHLVA